MSQLSGFWPIVYCLLLKCRENMYMVAFASRGLIYQLVKEPSVYEFHLHLAALLNNLPGYLHYYLFCLLTYFQIQYCTDSYYFYMIDKMYIKDGKKE